MVSDPDFQTFSPWVLYMWDVWGTLLSLFKMFEDRRHALDANFYWMCFAEFDILQDFMNMKEILKMSYAYSKTCQCHGT
jgi:hypothetical protein